MWVLIASFHGHCLLLTWMTTSSDARPSGTIVCTGSWSTCTFENSDCDKFISNVLISNYARVNSYFIPLDADSIIPTHTQPDFFCKIKSLPLACTRSHISTTKQKRKLRLQNHHCTSCSRQTLAKSICRRFVMAHS